jgi:hypothetical protein
VVILNGDISLLYVGLTAEMEYIQNKSVHIFVFSVELLKSNGEGLGNLHNKSAPTAFI